MSKADKPHGQWRCLTAMTTLHPFGVTSADVGEAIHVTTGVAVTRSGTRTRLKELADMGLVSVHRPETSQYSLYALTRNGWDVAKSTIGMDVLRALRNTHVTLEAERAAELGPIKEKWQNIIHSRMRMISCAMLGDG